MKDDKSIEGFTGQQESVINQIIDCLGIQPQIEVEKLEKKKFYLLKLKNPTTLLHIKTFVTKELATRQE